MDKDERYYQDMREMHREPSDHELDEMLEIMMKAEKTVIHRRWVYLGIGIGFYLLIIAIILIVT
jgi:hypothetical protein